LQRLYRQRHYAVRRHGGDLVVFCFRKPEHADAFCQCFEGERLPGGTGE
jgi:hypothetical protein